MLINLSSAMHNWDVIARPEAIIGTKETNWQVIKGTKFRPEMRTQNLEVWPNWRMAKFMELNAISRLQRPCKALKHHDIR